MSAIVTWRWTGYNALIYLAGMQAIDTSLYEAAAIDGASRWQQFRHVTIPGLRPTILFTIVVSTIGASQLFGEPLLYHRRTCPTAARPSQYQTLGLLMYQQGWTNDRLGLASATAWTMFADHRAGRAGQPAGWPAAGSTGSAAPVACRPPPDPGGDPMTSTVDRRAVATVRRRPRRPVPAAGARQPAGASRCRPARAPTWR